MRIILNFEGVNPKETMKTTDNNIFDLNRFVEAQEHSYASALAEIRAGRKSSHWVWYIFPQIKGLGQSYNSEYYGIESLDEARAYLQHEVLGARLCEITKALLEHRGCDAIDVLGCIDAVKVRSSMTLFDVVSPNNIFAEVLDAFYDGQRCNQTLQKMEK